MQNYNPKTALGRWKSACSRTNYKKTVHWVNYLVPPLARAICRAKNWTGFSFDGPCGLCCRVWIEFFEKDQKVFCLEVSNPDLINGTLMVTNYKENTGDYEPNTIVAMNGMNHPSVTIEATMDVDKVLQYGYVPEADDLEPTTKIVKV